MTRSLSSKTIFEASTAIERARYRNCRTNSSSRGHFNAPTRGRLIISKLVSKGEEHPEGCVSRGVRVHRRSTRRKIRKDTLGVNESHHSRGAPNRGIVSATSHRERNERPRIPANRTKQPRELTVASNNDCNRPKYLCSHFVIRAIDFSKVHGARFSRHEFNDS